MPPTLQATLPHFELVNHQLRQLRVLFALAQVGRPAERVCTEGQRVQHHAPPPRDNCSLHAHRLAAQPAAPRQPDLLYLWPTAHCRSRAVPLSCQPFGAVWG